MKRNSKFKLGKLLKNEEGANAIEYGLIAALIAVAAITAMSGLGSQLNTTLSKVKNEIAKCMARLSWADRLEDRLPTLTSSMRPETRGVTLLELVTHRSGLSFVQRRFRSSRQVGWT